jgi:transformation/transcription domain-associated protein
LKQAFVPHLEQLFDDDILFGSGLTVKENLRPLGYHVIAELVHQLRLLLSYNTLTAATHAFLTNLHDDTLQLTVHVFSAKLIAALVDCITKTDGSAPPGDVRNLLLRIFSSFTERLHTMAKLRLKEFQFKIDKSKGEVKTEEDKRNDDSSFGL